jgi:hypothetical protein
MTYNKKGRGKVKDDNAMYYLHIFIQDSKIAAIKKNAYNNFNCIPTKAYENRHSFPPRQVIYT